MSHDQGENGWSLVRAIQDFIAELWSLVLFSWLMPRRNHVPTDEEHHDTGVKSVAKIDDRADHDLERSAPERMIEKRTAEGSETGREDDVSDEFLSQLEQRTQQVKITLANLEAEKVRIEGLIAQLQPIVPHYDALVAAERQIAEAQISLEPGQAVANASAAAKLGLQPGSLLDIWVGSVPRTVSVVGIVQDRYITGWTLEDPEGILVSLNTVPTPTPSSLAILRTPTPRARIARTFAARAGSASSSVY